MAVTSDWGVGAMATAATFSPAFFMASAVVEPIAASCMDGCEGGGGGGGERHKI